MKNSDFFRRSQLLSLLIIAFLGFSANAVYAQQEVTPVDPVGTWIYSVETPEGALSGEMSIEKVDGVLEVTIESDVYGRMELEDIDYEKNILVATTQLEGGTIEFEWKFDGDYLEGYVYTPDGDIPMEAERKKN